MDLVDDSQGEEAERRALEEGECAMLRLMRSILLSFYRRALIYVAVVAPEVAGTSR